MVLATHTCRELLHCRCTGYRFYIWCADLPRVATRLRTWPRSYALNFNLVHVHQQPIPVHLYPRTSIMSSQQNMACASPDLYVPVPVYYSSKLQDHAPVGYKSGDQFIAGCTCAQEGSECEAHDDCRCEGNITSAGGDICDYGRCKACKQDRRRCQVRPGCECRRNAGHDHMFVCNELCHGQHSFCWHQVRLSSAYGLRA